MWQPERWIPLAVLCFLSFLQAAAQEMKRSDQEPNRVERKIIPPEALQIFDADRYREALSDITNTLIFPAELDLRKRFSLVSEELSYPLWVPTNRLVEVAEEVLVDSIWITAHEYYGLWDSKKVDSYDFDPREFDDTLQVILYDPYFGSNWSVPVENTEINSPFGRRWYRWHHGADLKLSVGDPVKAAFDGIVRVRSYERQGYGHYLVLRHRNGLETLYGHLSRVQVAVGQEIRAGDVLGEGGNTGRSTGPHLHFEVRYRGLSIDPTEIFDFEIGRIRSQVFQLTANSFEHEIRMRESIYHRVRSGENLSLIARRYGVRMSQITRLNGISTRAVLQIGQRLQIQ
jgi:murein DD-endopeptidase MepM/ murein hydrolase activator NlpD